MKIKVADLEPNPFRDISKYPIDKSKIESLKLSIRETSFWDNILARKRPTKKGKFQISYGHHRLQAVKEVGIKEVDIPVKELSDAQMIKIMAEENLEWATSPKVVYQTVLAVRRFLDKELGKYDIWEQIRSNRYVRTILSIENGQAFAKLKGVGVGQNTILKFLGGNWKQWMIQPALQADDRVKENRLDMKAVLEFDVMEQAKQFQRAVEEYEIPVDKQLNYAKKVKENIRNKKTATTHHTKAKKSIVEDVREQFGKPKTKKAKQNEVKRIIIALNDIEKKARILADRLEGLRIDIKKLGIEEMSGLEPALAKFALKRLYKEMEVWKGLKNEQFNSRVRRISGNVLG